MSESPPSAPGRIFISYRRQDTAFPAGWLFDQLTDHFGRGHVFKDIDSIRLGDDFVEVLNRAVGSCDVLLALIGKDWLTVADAQGRRRLDDPDDFVRLEIETALARHIRVIPVLVDGARMPRADQLPDRLVSLVRRQALELSPARFESDTGRLLHVLDQTISEVQATPMAAAALPAAARDSDETETCPYRGLAAFREPDADVFFGREAFTARLLDAVRSRSLVALVGASGSGKSSVLFAGLLPALADEGDWVAAAFRPGRDPFHSLAAALLPVFDPGSSPAGRLLETPKLADVVRQGRLGEVIDKVSAAQQGRQVLLLGDQFEELFTLCPDDVQRDFLKCVLGPVTASPVSAARPLTVLVALRADFYGQALQHRILADALQDADILLGPMTREELRRAVEEPARARSVRFETGLVDRILDDVEHEPAHLPLVEFTLTELWEEQTARRLTHRAYEELGGIDGALACYADGVVDKLAETERDRVRRVFVQLVRPGEATADTRRLANRSELDPADWTLVQRLADERLVVTDRDPAGRETAEVVHEALIQRWPRLRSWMDEDREFRVWQERFRSAVDVWQRADRDQGALLRGGPLAEAERWFARRRTEISSVEQDFLNACREAQAETERRRAETEKQRRRLRISLIVSATLSVLLFAMVWLGVLAWLNSVAAKRQQQLATYEKTLHSDPAASLHAALQAWRERPWWTKPSPDAESAVRNAFDANRQRAVLRGHRGKVVTSQFAPDGRTVLTAGEDGTAALFRTSTGELLYRLTPSGDGPRSPLTGALFSPDGSMVVTAARNGQVLVYDAVSGRQRATLADSGVPAFATWGSLRGRPVVLTYGPHGTPALWDPATPKRRIARYGTSGTAAGGAGLSRDGRYVVTVGSDAVAQVWEATSGQRLARSPVLGNKAAQPLFVTTTSGGVAVSAMERQIWQVVFWDWRVGSVKPTGVVGPEPQRFAVSKDGRLVAANRDKSVIVLDGETGTVRGYIPDARDRVSAMDFSRDGRRLAIGDDSGSALIWNTAEIEETNPAAITSGRSPRPVDELLALSGSVSDVRFAPHDRSASTVVTAGGDGTARTWRLPNYLRVSGAAGSSVFDADTSRDGRVVTAESFRGDGWLRVRRSDNGALEREWFRPREQFRQAVFTPDTARIVAVATVAYRPLVWAWRTNNELRLVENDRSITPSLAVSPDGRTVAAGDYSNRVIVWDLNTGKIRVRLGDRNNENRIQHVAYIGSTQLAAASSDGTVRIWDLHDPSRPKGTLPQGNEAGGITAIAVSRDDTHLVTVAEDRTLRVWNVSDGRPNVTIPTQVGTIKDITFSPDGSLLVGGVADGTVHMWRWRDRDNREFAVLRRHSEAVDSVKFTGDGKNMVTVGSDAIAIIYPCTVCRSFPAVLRDAEQRDRLLS